MSLDVQSIRDSAVKLRKALKNNSKRPTPGDIHKLRTRVRRVESTANALTLSVN
jgi:CHAD domain-containing protein